MHGFGCIVAVGIVCVTYVLGATAMAAPTPATRPVDTRVMSFNIRYANPEDGPNFWPFRRDLLIRTVRDFGPDLLGCQEVLATQQDDLAKALADYGTVAVGRNDGKRAGEASSIFFRKSRYDLRTSGTFWLSETPDRVGSKGWDAALPRICTWAVLHDRQGDRDVAVFNTHFDNAGEVARTQSATLLRTRIPQIAGDRPVILSGDLNSDEATAAYAEVVRSEPLAATLADTYRECHQDRKPDEATFHAFKGSPFGTRIDFIFTSPQWRAVSCEISRAKSADGRWPSDHFPVTAVLRLK